MQQMISLLPSIGHLTLNVSFVLYLVVYIPQIIHNQKNANIAQLSVILHVLLFLSYLFDLLYGFASHLPWQYKTVSIVGLVLVTIQHIQLIKFFIAKELVSLVKTSIFLLIISVIVIYYFFVMREGALTNNTILILGVGARICGLIYCLPQLIKNSITKSANALSSKYIHLNLILALLDTCSSWCLNWGWPNKLAAPITAIIMLVMLYQINRYQHQPSGLQLKGMQV